MSSQNLYFIDLDGTIINVGDRFINNPPPVKKDRKDLLYQQWLTDIQTPELLSKDIPVPGMQEFVNSLSTAVYLTSRSEVLLNDTIKWLRTHNFPAKKVIMRHKSDISEYDVFKEKAIKQHVWEIAQKENSIPEAYNVIVIDDDNHDKLFEVCTRNGWVLLKAKSGGIVT